MKKKRPLIIALLLTTTLFFISSATRAQQTDRQGGASATTPPASHPTWRISFAQIGPQTFVTLHAKDAPVGEIAAELSKKFKIPIVLSSAVKSQLVTLELDKQLLETTLMLLVPQAWADYEISGTAGTPKKLVGVYLQASSDLPPPVNLYGNSSAVVFEGNTEDGIETEVNKPSAEPRPLSVIFKNNRLSVTAHHQLLISVLSEIARLIGCNFTVLKLSEETVDLSLHDVALEDAPLLISPSARFRLRTKLSTQETVLMQVILDAQPEQNGKPNSAERN